MPDPADVDDRFPVVTLNAGETLYRSYQLKYGYDSFNPGPGDTRFAPISDPIGVAVPTMYAAVTAEAALLETIFHEVHQSVKDRIVYEAVARRWGIAYVETPVPLRLADLRDPALGGAGLGREQLVATNAEHYACTRQWSEAIHNADWGRQPVDGLVWYSRQAELHPTSDDVAAVMLFGDRAPSAPGDYALVGPGVRNLTEAEGRALLERLATDLEARVEPADN